MAKFLNKCACHVHLENADALCSLVNSAVLADVSTVFSDLYTILPPTSSSTIHSYMSHFDTFDPKDDDSGFHSSKRLDGFSGKDLLFVALSFTLVSLPWEAAKWT